MEPPVMALEYVHLCLQQCCRYQPHHVTVTINTGVHNHGKAIDGPRGGRRP